MLHAKINYATNPQYAHKKDMWYALPARQAQSSSRGNSAEPVVKTQAELQKELTKVVWDVSDVRNMTVRLEQYVDGELPTGPGDDCIGPMAPLSDSMDMREQIEAMRQFAAEHVTRREMRRHLLTAGGVRCSAALPTPA